MASYYQDPTTGEITLISSSNAPTPTPPPASPTQLTIKKVRPSPRTGSTGVGIQKFGTQQLKHLDTGGVIEKDVGARFRLFTGGQATTPATPFSASYQQQRPATIRTQAQLETSPHAIPLLPDFGDFQFPDFFGGGAIDKHGCECENCKNGTGQCSDKNPKCNSWDIGCELFGAIDKHGCECQACKDGTGQCSDKNPKCNSWDLGCEISEGVTDIITKPTGDWWEKNKNWVYLILGVIGLGILLWLLRPLFGMIGAFKGGSP